MDDPAVMIQEEATELFNRVGGLLKQFEDKQNDAAFIEQLQVGFHSIKVLCTLLALSETAALARKVDETFSAIQNDTIRLSPEIINITTASFEQLKEEIEADLENTPIDANQTKALMADWDSFIVPVKKGASKTGRISADGPPRLLIIDDEAVSRKLLENMIRKYDDGIEIVSVDTAEEGIYYYLTEEFDLVFLDIIMPIVDGNDFLAIVDKNYERGHLKDVSNIVVQTAVESMEQLLSYIKKTCVQEVIRKPVTPERITDCLERYCHA